MHKFRNDTLVIATHNTGKVQEFRDLLGGHVKEIVSAGEMGLPEPEETGETFLDNAIIKARAAANASGHVALADDSGLCVTALGGKPGLLSARWAGPGKDFNVAMQRIHDELGAATDRSAHFVCVLALVWPDGHAALVEERCNGAIVWPPRGSKGHGYDPVFLPDGHDRTFAEMEADEKHALSHRGKALRAMAGRYFSS